ncbi:hypothetical protein T4E_3911 [Trichinella pseudospiralis]|uniref:DUF5641 domain-containing protein n=1 Tax=Trichinella pseudospiralis TaxID=6337 RepID=A0A0V0YKT2_TRIPS|nr:hypothetical protein T4E_3911 [Trichinella pseudospiralis]
MLSWIESEARNWKPFIQNRIELIQQLTKPNRSSTVPHFWQSCESNGLAFLIHKELPRLVGSESGELTAGDLEKKSRLLTLTPVVDDIGLIYVGNRLQRLHLRCQHKYPVILLNKYPFMVVAIRPKEWQAETHAINGAGIDLAGPFYIKEGRIIAKTYQLWRKDYLVIFSYRQKWTAQRTESKIANIVLVCEDNENRNSRPLRRILQLYPGPDGIIQSVRVKTAARSFARLTRKLWLIEGATWRWDSSIAGRYKRQNDKLYCTTSFQ